MLWHPLRFVPIYQERVWGDRSLARLYQRQLPGSRPIGESWEISDRPEAVSVVAEGPLAGRPLDSLLAADPTGLLGDAPAREGRFPLLVKILAAHENLSVQVHPPARLATSLGGESKTEMWYFTDVAPGARIFAGLHPGTTRIDFESAVRSGTVGDCLHSATVRPGDVMFLPSGRVHALGAGLVLFEIQENSNTTYRVFDWNRPGLDGKPRPLQVEQSLASIDFQDFAPRLADSPWIGEGPGEVRRLVDDPLFRVEAHRRPAGIAWSRSFSRCQILGLVRGELRIHASCPLRTLGPGDFCLFPAALRQLNIEVSADAEWLMIEPGANPQPPAAS